jgi:hypothetical protein
VDVANSGASDFFMNNVQIRNCTGGGVYLHPGSGGSVLATVNHSILDQNGRGLRAEDNTIVSIRDTSATGNIANGFVGQAVGAGSVDMTLDNVQSSNNSATGVFAGLNTTVRMANSIVVRNANGLQATAGGAILSWGNNFVNANTGSNGPASGPIAPL